MPSSKTIPEDQEPEEDESSTAVDNFLNTNYREKPRKKKHRDSGKGLKDLAPIGLPVTNQPKAGTYNFFLSMIIAWGYLRTL